MENTNLKDIKKRTYEEIRKTGKKKYRIFKPIKKYDIEIRTIEEEYLEKDKDVYFVVVVGFYESLGEQGENYTLLYDETPTEEEIINESIERLKEDKKGYENTLISYREEEYLKILKEVIK